jgi:hypothetical protein
MVFQLWMSALDGKVGLCALPSIRGREKLMNITSPVLADWYNEAVPVLMKHQGKRNS